MDELEYQDYLNQINYLERKFYNDETLLEPLANEEMIVPGCFWVRPAPTEQ